MDTMIILGVIFIVAAVRCICIVPQASEWIVEFLGKYQATWTAGLHFKIPIIMNVAKKVSLKEQVADFEPQPVITSDNVTMMVDSVVYFRVNNTKLYTYGVERPIAAIENLAATTLRNLIGAMTLDETLTSRETVNAKMLQTIDEATDPWGIKITRVELKNISPPPAITQSMEKQMKAERDKRAMILQAEGLRQSQIEKAEGEKQSKILAAEAEKEANIRRAEGLKESQLLEAEGKAKAIEQIAIAESEAIMKVNKAILESGTDERVIALKQVEALKEMANNPANKLILPNETLSSLGSIAAIGEMLKKDK